MARKQRMSLLILVAQAKGAVLKTSIRTVDRVREIMSRTDTNSNFIRPNHTALTEPRRPEARAIRRDGALQKKRRMAWPALALAMVFTLATPMSGVAATRYNVVVVVTDDQSFDSLPVMRKLMSFPGGSWVRFKKAFAEHALCCPTRATLLTGQYAFKHGVIKNAVADQFNDRNTLPVWLDDAGYRTALFGKYMNDYPWDKGEGYVPPGWDVFESPPTSIGSTDDHTGLAVDFIKRSKRRFFLYLAYRDPHRKAKVERRYRDANVYVPPARANVNEADVSDKPEWIRSKELLTDQQLNEERTEQTQAQRALLAVDDGVKRIVRALRRKGVLKKTIVIFLSDNGYSWGAHRHLGKSCAYEECSRIPLLIRYPGVKNHNEGHYVSTVDISPTILAATNVRAGLRQHGRDLTRLITKKRSSWRDRVLLEGHAGAPRTYFGIRVAGWTYVEYENGERELYDMHSDRHQMSNRADDPAYADKQRQLARRLQKLKEL
jgi:N-acetylglucosamine-6-sulfatase